MNNNEFIRPDGRKYNQTREISFQKGFAPNATGSVLVSFGNTRVICAACLEKKVPNWMRDQADKSGWITAEYSMLPYSTLTRKQRPSNGKIDGRSVEIQRLIGRALRAVTDLSKIAGYTLSIDCDVLQADGGTRTASITGAFVAASLAVKELIASGQITESPFIDNVAAISVGIYNGQLVLDLPYEEDKDAEVDANIAMTGSGKFVEVQSSGEEATFDYSQLNEMLALAKEGIESIVAKQNEIINS
ncbi:MAG: ribonuclease PH [Opitutales bacterium]